MSSSLPKSNFYSSSTLETAALVSGSVSLVDGGALLGLIADSDGYAAPCWVQVFDGYQAPSSGAVPLVSIRITSSNAQASLDVVKLFGVSVSQGIVVVLSNSIDTYLPITNSLFVSAWWVGR